MSARLSERRAGDRKFMAEHVAAIATARGATAEIRPMIDKEVWVLVKVPGGAKITIDFDGRSSQPDIHVVTWNIDTASDATFSGAMPDVNRYHRRKSTMVCAGFEALCSMFTATLDLLVSGHGYGEPRPSPARDHLRQIAAQHHAERNAA